MGETRRRKRATASFSTAPSLLIVLLLAVAAAGIRCSFQDDSFSKNSASGSSPSPSPGDATSSVWVAVRRTVVQIDATTNQRGTVLPLSYVPVGLALDPSDGGLWVLGPQHLTAFDAAGTIRFARKLTDLVPGLPAATHIALNGYDSSAWIAAGDVLLHINGDGTLLAQWSAGADIRALALDWDESVWVLSENELVHLSPEAAVLGRFLLSDLQDWGETRPTHLVLDPLGAKLWLASATKIVQLDTTNPGPGKAVALPGNVMIRGISLDIFAGVLWALAGGEILRIDRDLQLLQPLDLAALNLQNLTVLAFDPASRSFWVATGSAVTHLSSQGEALGRVALVSFGGLLKIVVGFETLVVTPSLTLIDPVPDVVTRDATPTFHLELGASCNRQPCDPGDAYKEGLTISAELNGQSITSLLTRAGTEVTHTPMAALPEGLSTLTARALDAFGHGSEELTASITVDTTPPAFVGLTPPDGTRVEAHEAVIEGTVDDPRATVVLMDAGGNVLSVGSTPFAFRVTLTAGANTFRLTARDAAGNEASVTLNLVQGRSEIDITSHPDGTTVEDDGMVLSGTFEGPPNTGITVNGTVAQTFGNQFFAAVPLVSGGNTLTIVMTRPDGTRVTRTLTVNSTSSGTRPIEVRAQPASGIAPLKVTFTVVNNAGRDLKNLEIDFDGNGTVDITTADPEKPIEHSYTTTGVFLAKSVVRDDAGNTYRATHAIVVKGFDSMEQMLRGVYTGMLDRLRVGDIPGALTFIAGSTQPKYEAVFKALEPNLATVVDKLGTIERISIGEEFAELTIVREKNGERRAYFIYLLRSEDGVWRIESM